MFELRKLKDQTFLTTMSVLWLNKCVHNFIYPLERDHIGVPADGICLLRTIFTVKWRAEELSAIFMHCLISLQKKGVFSPCSIILFIIHEKDCTNSAISIFRHLEMLSKSVFFFVVMLYFLKKLNFLFLF